MLIIVIRKIASFLSVFIVLQLNWQSVCECKSGSFTFLIGIMVGNEHGIDLTLNWDCG